MRPVRKPFASRKVRSPSPGRPLVGGDRRPQVGQGRAIYDSSCQGMRDAVAGLGLRSARPALVRPADERLRTARRAGDRVLPPGPRKPELFELPAIFVAG